MKPCVRLRDETEWIELIAHELNCLANADSEAIYDASIRLRVNTHPLRRRRIAGMRGAVNRSEAL